MTKKGMGQGKVREPMEEGIEVGAAKERVEEHHGREDGGEEWHGGG